MKRFINLAKLSFATVVFVVLCAPHMVQAGCVYLKTLEANTDGDSNVLTWSTMAETNNGFFLIERSNNGIDFEQAARIRGAGTSLDQKNYSYTDIENRGLRVFYRLLQVDIDGAINTSNTVLINRKGAYSVFEIVSMEGAVTDNYFNLNINSTVAGDLEYRLQTKMGKVLQKGEVNVVKGENAVSVDLSTAEVGTYQFSIRIKNEIEVLALKKVEESIVPESILTIKEEK